METENRHKNSCGCGCGCHEHEGETHEHEHADSCGCGCGCHEHEDETHEHEHADSCGCGCGCHEHGHEEGGFKGVALSATLLAAALFFDYMHFSFFQNPWLRPAWYVLAFLPVGFDVMLQALKAARKGDWFSEFLLMSVASVGAFAIGEYPEGVAVMLLYCVGEAFQDRAVTKARNHISALAGFRPDKARVVEGTQTRTVQPETVMPGTVIEVLPGERVPLDGLLKNERGELNTAALTGESLPQTKKKGDEVLAGMIVVGTALRLEVVRKVADSAISRMMQLVQEATQRKAPTERFIRKFARIYTPVVMALALLTCVLPALYGVVNPSFHYQFATWFHRALVFLVISCPCALVISVPLSYFTAIGAASTKGILFKGGQFVDAMTHIDTVVFDKTGTLTTGIFSVQKVEGLTPDELKTVAGMEKMSNHPIAKAVCQYAEGSTDMAVTEVPGFGLKAENEQEQWLVGTAAWMEKNGIDYPKEVLHQEGTTVLVAGNGRYKGCITLADTLKPEALQAVKALRKAGVKHIEILSGDKQQPVDRIARLLNVDKASAELLPHQKLKAVEQLAQQRGNVAFVGDGMNDAPVLAAAQVGIAMGAKGSDMAIEVADVVIQTDHVTGVAQALHLSRFTRRIVWQNIALALGVKLAVMALGLAGMANLWAAIFADSGVALLAVLNALRIFTLRQKSAKG